MRNFVDSDKRKILIILAGCIAAYVGI